MRPEIDAYLREHGARYTTESLRKQLISAGHDPAEVDAALRELEEARAPEVAATRALGRRYWRIVLGVNLAALIAATIVTLFGPNGSYVLLVVLVLGLALVTTMAVTGLIGAILLGRTGLAVALILPVLAALLLGGWCIAGMSGGRIL